MPSSLYPSFFLLALIALVLNTIKDIREMKIDERRNWFILGAVLMMYSQVYVPHQLLMFLLVPFGINWLFSKAGLASGDKSTLVYLGLGYLFFGFKALMIFILVVLVGQLVVGLTVRYLFKIKGRYPFMPVILGSHIAMGLLYMFTLA